MIMINIATKQILLATCDNCYSLIISVVILQHNYTALHYAAGSGNYNVVDYLINHGARVNDVDNVSCITTYSHLY